MDDTPVPVHAPLRANCQGVYATPSAALHPRLCGTQVRQRFIPCIPHTGLRDIESTDYANILQIKATYGTKHRGMANHSYFPEEIDASTCDVVVKASTSCNDLPAHRRVLEKLSSQLEAAIVDVEMGEDAEASGLVEGLLGEDQAPESVTEQLARPVLYLQVCEVRNLVHVSRLHCYPTRYLGLNFRCLDLYLLP